MPEQTPEVFAAAVANRVKEASKSIERTESRRESFTRRGRPPQLGRERTHEAKEDTSPIIESIRRHRPLILSDIPDTPDNANQILCAFMFSAMEILAGIAENRRVPISQRRQCAEILVNSGLITVPKKTQSLSATLNAKTVEEFAKMFDKVEPDQLSRMMNEEPLEQEAAPVSLGQIKSLATGVTQVRPGSVKHLLSVEDKILELVSRYGSISEYDLAERVRGLSSAKIHPWKDTLKALVDRGTLEVFKGPRGGDWFRFATRETEAKEES